MIKNVSSILRATALGAALAITSTPMLTGLAATGLTLMAAGEAMAQGTVPGVGSVIKKKPGNIPRKSRTSDDKGNFTYKELEAGEYSICFADDRGEGDSCADVDVGKDGTVSGQTVFDPARKEKNKNYTGHIVIKR